MKIKPEELADNGYVLMDELGHMELVPFIRTYMKKRTGYSFFFNLGNKRIFGFAGYSFMIGYNQPDFDPGNRFTPVCYGLAIDFTLIPHHEYIQFLPFKTNLLDLSLNI